MTILEKFTDIPSMETLKKHVSLLLPEDLNRADLEHFAGIFSLSESDMQAELYKSRSSSWIEQINEKDIIVAILNEPINADMVAKITIAKILGKKVLGVRGDVRGPYGGGMHFFPRLAGCDILLEISSKARDGEEFAVDLIENQNKIVETLASLLKEKNKFSGMETYLDVMSLQGTPLSINALSQDITGKHLETKFPAKIYFAGGLFNDRDTQFNLRRTLALEKAGHKVVLPQRDGFEFGNLLKALEENQNIPPENRFKVLETIIFYLDIGRFVYKETDTCLVRLDTQNDKIDEGAVVEMIMAKALGKRVVGHVTSYKFEIPQVLIQHCDVFIKADCDSEDFTKAVNLAIERTSPKENLVNTEDSFVGQIIQIAESLFKGFEIRNNWNLKDQKLNPWQTEEGVKIITERAVEILKN